MNRLPLVLVLLLACGGCTTPGPKVDSGLPDPGVAEAETETVVLPDLYEIPDVPEPRDLGPSDAPPQQGQPGWPCADNAECLSGWCIETPDGRECAALCLSGEACPEGYECVQVATVPDVQYSCVHPAPRTCRPCRTDSDCGTGLSTKTMFCDVADGLHWCVAACEKDDCFPEGGCKCTPLGEGVTGKCDRTNGSGTCSGEWTCKDGAPTDCTAPEAKPESCNNADDDCDGSVDEGLTSGTCEIKNAYGTCPGTLTCVAGTELCQGSEPKQEVCNGLDENCDGATDEGFADLDGDAVADCVDPDRDGDGVVNETDNCPDAANPDQEDTDQDKSGDACDGDDDDDGVLDPFDNCPKVKNADQKDANNNGVGDACDGDRDGDGIPNEVDNCPDVANAGQEDLDQDGLGDLCDGDLDGDGVLNPVDNCLTLPNPGQEDLDKDGMGDACDPDRDGDTVVNETDNCPDLANLGQEDGDQDGLGDACDPDRDGDGVLNESDNCPGTFNPDQTDTNGDGVGDACENDWDGDGVSNADDNCPLVANAGQEYLDLDSQGDACDCDLDGDGVGNTNPQCPEPQPADNCPRVPNADQADLDQDGQGDACDQDRDGDKDPDATDCAPADPLVFHGQVESCNGVDDDCDAAVDEEGATGCTDLYLDADGDGFGVQQSRCLCAPDGNWRAPVAGDCNDTVPEVNPAATEVCGNGRDDNCNGSETEEDAIGCVRYYTDLDSDGYGTGDGRCLCTSSGDLTAKLPGDCDDLDPTSSPGLQEKCIDGRDNDCDGTVDEEGCQGCTTYYRDDDKDGYGVDGDKRCLGKPEAPYTAEQAGDCDETNAAVHPNAAEACNDIDDNCDGTTDPLGSLGCTFLYPDADRDGWGANVPSTCLCGPTGAYTAEKSGD